MARKAVLVSIVSLDPYLLDIEVADESTVKKMRVKADWYGDYEEKDAKERLDTALKRINNSNSVTNWLYEWELTQQIANTAEYTFVTKARARKLYDRSAEWLRKELKKVPCSIPCRDVTHKGLWLLSSEHERLAREESERLSQKKAKP